MLKEDGSRQQLGHSEPRVIEDGEVLKVSWQETDGTSVAFECRPDTLEWSVRPSDPKAVCWAEMTWSSSVTCPITAVKPQQIDYKYENYDYSVRCIRGTMSCEYESHTVNIRPQNGVISLKFKR